jgi:hypothetical protein
MGLDSKKRWWFMQIVGATHHAVDRWKERIGGAISKKGLLFLATDSRPASADELKYRPTLSGILRNKPTLYLVNDNAKVMFLLRGSNDRQKWVVMTLWPL